jgi:hypothetical protein
MGVKLCLTVKYEEILRMFENRGLRRNLYLRGRKWRETEKTE